MDLIALVDGLRNHRGMYLQGESYADVANFLVGVNHSGALNGIQELVDLKFGRPSSVHWVGLIHQIEPAIDVNDEGADELAVQRLLDVLEELITIDQRRNGLRVLMYDWVCMAQAQSWFDDHRLRFDVAANELELVDLDTASVMLSLSRSEVLSLVRDRRLRAGRVGAEVHVSRATVERYLVQQRSRADG